MFTFVRRAAVLFVLPVVVAGAVVISAAPPASASVASTTAMVVSLTNKQRAKHGCPKVRTDSRLVKAAQAHSAYQARRTAMTHTGKGGTTFVTRAKRAGYNNGLSENVAWGHGTASAVVTAWMKSPGHRRNILNCKARAVGVGVATGSDRSRYWTQVFGRV